MPSGSIGSHRAFMGVSITMCVILSLTLYVGWKFYFFNVASRNSLIEKAKIAEKKAQDLEKLGISFEPPPAAQPPMALPQIPAVNAGAAASTPSPPPSSPVPDSVTRQESSHPHDSIINVLPLQETSDEVVEAIGLLDQYWKTASWKDRIPLVARPERVKALMRDYYEVQKASDPSPGALVSKARYEIDGCEILYFSYASTRPTGSLEIAMLRGPQGKFLIDWESLTGYGEMSFQDFRSKKPATPVLMRSYVRLFEYYNYEFSNPKKYLCIKLISESGDNSLYAYCERGTQLAEWIEKDLASTGPTGFKGYTMLISFPANAQSNQCVNLDKVVTQRWLNLP